MGLWHELELAIQVSIGSVVVPCPIPAGPSLVLLDDHWVMALSESCRLIIIAELIEGCHIVRPQLHVDIHILHRSMVDHLTW